MISFKQFLESTAVPVGLNFNASGHTHWMDLSQQLTKAIGTHVALRPDAFDDSLINIRWSPNERDKDDLLLQAKLIEKYVVKHLDKLGFTAVNWDGPLIQFHALLKSEPLISAKMVVSPLVRLRIVLKLVAGPET